MLWYWKLRLICNQKLIILVGFHSFKTEENVSAISLWFAVWCIFHVILWNVQHCLEYVLATYISYPIVFHLKHTWRWGQSNRSVLPIVSIMRLGVWGWGVGFGVGGRGSVVRCRADIHVDCSVANHISWLCLVDVNQVKDRLRKMGMLQPLNIFLRQEIDRMQKVITAVRITLTDLKLAIEGTIIMSEVRCSNRVLWPFFL